MGKGLKTVTVTLGWAVILSNILLNAIYQGLPVNIWILLSIFAVSVFAGLILVNIDRIVAAAIVSLILSILIMFFCLSLPAILAKIEPGLEDLLYAGALGWIVKYIFPFPTLLCILGGLIGGMVGEWMKIT